MISNIKQLIPPVIRKNFAFDPLLFFCLFLLMFAGLMILYSASNQNFAMVERQAIRLCLGLLVMMLIAQIPPQRFYQLSSWLYGGGILLLLAVLVIGKIDKGAQRWLNLGLIKLQPSEFMKIIVPMMLASYLYEKALPLKIKDILISAVLLIIPVILTIKQPDLGTGILLAFSGVFVFILAGISWRWVLGAAAVIAGSMPILWHFMHGYQKNRILTFLNPARDPLGNGYHIIQSKIAVGSGGLFGKGWLHGTQSHLHFLPAHTTDFIFSVSAEEFGLMGCILLITLFLLLLARCLTISMKAQNTYTRLLAGSLSLTFIIEAFLNMGMVIGIVPVVGIPLPFLSYGGSSILTMMAGFGIIISIHSHRKLWSS